ncbi:MAG TPA: alpha/beta hydrolase [Dermatophilaceae bacterium]|nr:alpha/beta hydrolase [Actinomycetales bacterium]HMT33887.1 alpha/beta hydrolase [Dermatophilaceae bacterium]HMT88912.1 alpha/beta hydrolase [Dermatophilaceae bacterium]
MSRGRPSLLGMGVSLGAAGAAGALGAAGLIADRIRRREDAQLPEYSSLIEPHDQELAVVADDGVTLFVGIDEPTGDTRTEDGRPKPTVILSHGYCLTSECWVLQRRALKRAGYRVVVWDQRGHGRSGKGATAGYHIDQLGEDLYAVIQAVAPTGDLALGGHSMGGMTIMAMAAEYPEIIKDRTVAFACIATSPGSIPLASSSFVAASGKQLLERLGPGVFSQLQRRPELLTNLLKANRDLEEFLVERYSFASPVPRSVVRLTAKMILGTDLGVMSDFVPTFDAYDKTAALPYFAHCETLVFNGTQDVLTPPEHSEIIVRAIAGCEHVLIRDAGHVIMLEHPDLLNEQLLALLERAAKARAEHLDPAEKPRVTLVVTPVTKRRRVREGLTERRKREHAS